MAATSVLIDSNINAKNSVATPQPKVEQWEIDGIGKLIMQLYHAKKISLRSDWIITKQKMRQEYQLFAAQTNTNSEFIQKLNAKYGSLNIGTLLHRTGFLIDTPRGCNFYRIRYTALFQYRNNILKALDERHKNGEVVHFDNENLLNKNESQILHMDNIRKTYEIADNAEKHDVVFRGRRNHITDKNFILSSMGCCICQHNFETTEEYEEHVEYHSEESDFKSLDDMHESATPTFKLFYQVCKNSHFFGFTIEVLENNENDHNNTIIIDKIIIVQSRVMYYVHKNRMPYEMPIDGKQIFYIDSHLFTIYMEQPIVILFRYKAEDSICNIEQYHFMCVEELPNYPFAVNPRRLPNKRLFKSKFKLGQYMPSSELRKAIKADQLLPYILMQSNAFCDYYDNGKQFTLYNVCASMELLLQIEDAGALGKYTNLIQRKVILHNFDDQYSLKLSRNGHKSNDSILSIYDEVIVISDESELASSLTNSKNDERYEILLQNDDDIVLKAKSRKSSKSKIYFGVVDFVANERVKFVCDKKIPIEHKYTVIFRPNRLCTRYQYRGLELLRQMPGAEVKRFLFPEVVVPMNMTFERSQLTSDIVLKNETINNNPEQLQAVRYIAEGPRSEAPYIIHGPPGTGKTTTLVEAILQLYLRRPNTRILATAGSNSACDELALRLCGLLEPLDDARAIVRIYSRSNEQRVAQIDDLLLEHSNMYGGQFYPDVDVINEYRIVVCTLNVVGKLATGKFGKDNGKFSHVFVDEAAASSEVEILMALTCTLTESTRLIIAGDHKQLGPILKSEVAEELGLGVSLMERLIKRECYCPDEYGRYDPSIQTRLKRNHRSHPEIVQLYSDLFYDSKLIPMDAASEHTIGEKWCGSPNNDFPIIFHSVFGKSERDSSSSSLFNSQELEIVMDYVKDLMYFGIDGKKICECDIGIISPYKRQYMRIQEELNLRNWCSIQTGSVEIFQGKEKEIIIVSFVRSFLGSLGFLESMKRLNVTLSRAKSLMILIGNPKTLCQNEQFKSIIHLCNEKKTLVGRHFVELNGELPQRRRSSSHSRNEKENLKNLNESSGDRKVTNWRNMKNNERNDSGGKKETNWRNMKNNSANQQNDGDDVSEKGSVKSRRRRRYGRNKNNQMQANKNNNGEDQNKTENQTQRRQTMKKRIPSQNSPHKQRNFNTAASSRTTTSATTSLSSSPSSSSSSFVNLTLNNTNNIDKLFKNLPSLDEHQLATPRTTKVINENDLIDRARKLNINTYRSQSNKGHNVGNTKALAEQRNVNDSLASTSSTTAAGSTTKQNINSAFGNCRISNSPTATTASYATTNNSYKATTFPTTRAAQIPTTEKRDEINRNASTNVRTLTATPIRSIPIYEHTPVLAQRVAPSPPTPQPRSSLSSTSYVSYSSYPTTTHYQSRPVYFHPTRQLTPPPVKEKSSCIIA